MLPVATPAEQRQQQIPLWLRNEVGQLLQSAPHVIQIIMQASNAKTIHRFTRVCHAWCKYGMATLSHRQKIRAFCGNIHREKRVPPCLGLAPVITNLEHEPCLVLAFNKNKECVSFRHSSSCELYDNLSPNCTISAVAVEAGSFLGLPGYYTDEEYASKAVHQCLDNRSQAEEVVCLHAISFPKALMRRDDVYIRVIHFRETEVGLITSQRHGWFTEDLSVKMLLLIVPQRSRTDPEDTVRKLVRRVMQANNSHSALVGGIASRLAPPRLIAPPPLDLTEEEEIDNPTVLTATGTINEEYTAGANNRTALTGIVFGGSAVHAASVTIRPHEASLNAIKKRLQALQAEVDRWPAGCQTVAFMFACCDRSRTLAEAKTFAELFPDTPLLGMRSYGEIGCDYPAEAFVDPKKTKKARVDNDNIWLSLHTVVGIVGFER